MHGSELNNNLGSSTLNGRSSRIPIRQSARSQSHTLPRRQNSEEGRYEIKRILLTRGYRNHNVYNDLGVRVVGGKRQKNGDLAAYISAVSSTLNRQTQGEVRLGDEVVEWSGVLLRGKTFEEVERIVNSSHGEVEVVLRTEKRSASTESRTSTINHNRGETSGILVNGNVHHARRYNDELSPDRVPPVPMHRNGNMKTSNYDTISDSMSGHLQVALTYDGTSRLIVKILRARGLRPRDPKRYAPNPFVKVYLLPGRKVSHKRRTRFVDSSCDPEWNQVLEYHVAANQLRTMFLEFSVCDYGRDIEDLPLGHVQISLAEIDLLKGSPRWYTIQSDGMSTTYRPKNEESRLPSRHATYNYNPVSLDIGGYAPID